MIKMVTHKRIVLYASMIEQEVYSERRPLRVSRASRRLSQDVLHAIEERR
jgi:hypothetical protein